MKIETKHNLVALFDDNNKQLTQWFDGIELGDDFISGKVDFFIAYDNGKMALFNGELKRITDWVDYINPDGLLVGSKYYIIEVFDEKTRTFKEAIYHIDKGRVSDWFDNIYARYLLENKSKYYIVDKGRSSAIYHIDKGRISDWFHIVVSRGLVSGDSDYYIAINKDSKHAIFDKENNQISDWYDEISEYGLVSGTSQYYLVRDNDIFKIFKFPKTLVVNIHPQNLFTWFEMESIISEVKNDKEIIDGLKKRNIEFET